MSADVAESESYETEVKVLRVEVLTFFEDFVCRFCRDYHKLDDDMKQVDSGGEAEKHFLMPVEFRRAKHQSERSLVLRKEEDCRSQLGPKLGHGGREVGGVGR